MGKLLIIHILKAKTLFIQIKQNIKMRNQDIDINPHLSKNELLLHVIDLDRAYHLYSCLEGRSDSSLFSSRQFGLPRVEKEQFEREERAEMQQEILKKVARNLPVYTRTAGGGEASAAAAKLTSGVARYEDKM